MPDLKDFHLAEMKKWHSKAEAILDKAETEGRELLDEEDTELKAVQTRIAEHKSAVEGIEKSEARRQQLNDLGAVTDIASQEAVAVQAKSAGEAFVQSKEYKAIVEVAKSEGFPRFTTPEIEMKAAGDPVLESTGNNQDAIAPTWFGFETPGLVQFPLRIVDVLNVVQLTTGNTAHYPVVTTRSITDQTDTAEGENKAGAEFAFDFVDEVLKKWTAFGGASEEMFQDAPTLTNYINTELGIMALQKEERYIAETLYAGSVTAADGSGIGGVAGYDAVLEAMTLVEVAGGDPNAILINPIDWARLQAIRSGATNDGIYYSGGPYAALNSPLWGRLREVRTTRVPEGTALVGDFTRGARLFRKGGLRVDSTNSHDDWFRQNKVAIRGEIRSVLGVTYPEFFVEVEIGS
jgi:HK97 family phage major capsid protein